MLYVNSLSFVETRLNELSPSLYYPSEEVVSFTPENYTTTLGAKALNNLLTKTPCTFGLICGDSITPFQSTPSEAQRISERFGFKLPIYDITSGGAGLALFCETALNFKEEKYTLPICFVTADSAAAISYHKAAALVLSKEKNALSLVGAKYFPSEDIYLSIDSEQNLALSDKDFSAISTAEDALFKKACIEFSLDDKKVFHYKNSANGKNIYFASQIFKNIEQTLFAHEIVIATMACGALGSGFVVFKKGNL